ncbi:uncharacterized protein LOC134273817 isoform X2 [Saccostrea cucullata]|uniref:uncharacterized protein LOC134273817 isoform X2 n=1 Tax=Saccostrea cuccullata TaxID=36930 RepID=UPI002ED68634
MAFSYDFLIHFFFVITFSQALLIFEKCTRHSQCPANARCRPNGCEGYMCQCVSQFVYTDDRSQCVPGKLMGEDCDGNLNRCLSPFAVCMDSVCQCNELMEPTSDGHCKSPFEAELHHPCVDKICVLSTVCDGDVCVCPEDKREITPKEYWLDPLKARKCVDKNYSVDQCHGQDLQVPEDLLMDENNVIQSNNSVSQIVDEVQANDFMSENMPSNTGQDIVVSENKDDSKEIHGKLSEKDNSNPEDIKSGEPLKNHDEKTGNKVEDWTGIKDPSYSDVVNSNVMSSKTQVNDHFSNNSDDTTSEMLSSSKNSQLKTHPEYIDTNVKEGEIDTVPSDITEDFPANALSNKKLPSKEGFTGSSDNQNATLKIRNSSHTTEQSNHVNNDILMESTEGNFHNAHNFINKTVVSLLRRNNEGKLNQLIKLLMGRLSERNRKVDIYHGCSLDEECPEHAQCKRRGCNSQKQCLCRIGFMTNVNGTYCVPDGSRACLINEFTCEGSRCVPYSWVCGGITDCPQNDDETKFCSSHRMDVLPRQHHEEIDRLEDKLEHEALMRMHLERSIQDLRDVIKEIKQNNDIAESEKTNLITHDKPDPTALQTPSLMGEDRQISTWNDPLYDGFIDNIQNKLKGSVYTLWGGKVCPKHENTRTIYTGFMSSSGTELDRGAVGDFLCLPQVPEYDSSSSVKKVLNEQKNVVSGFTYHLSCSVCQVQLVSTVLMIPAKVTCPAEWRLEYVGVLVTAGVKKGEGGTRHICIEKTAFYDGGIEDSRDKGPYLFPVAVECGRIPCLPYKKNDNLSCVVCSF